jgi:hypothetical protein
MNTYLRERSLKAARVLALLAIALISTIHSPSASAELNQYGEWWDDSNGCLSLYNGAVYQPTGWCRRFPDPNNPYFWYQFSTINPQRPNWTVVDIQTPGWAYTTDFNSGVKYAIPFRGLIREVIYPAVASMWVRIEPNWLPYTRQIEWIRQKIAASPQYAPVGGQTFDPNNYADPGAAECYHRGWQWSEGTCWLPNPQ